MQYYVVSDVHVTGGIDQLANRNIGYLSHFIEELNQNRNSSKTFVFNGDFFDFYSVTLFKKKNDRKTVFKKAREIKKRNEDLFEKLNQWLENKNSLIFIIGNHDYLLSRYSKILKKVFFEKKYHRLIKIKENILINKIVFIEHGHRFDPLYYTKGPFRLMKKIRKNFRDNLIDVLCKYPKISHNRQIKYCLFYLLPFINLLDYLKLGLKSFLSYCLYSLLRIGNLFRYPRLIKDKEEVFKKELFLPTKKKERIKIKGNKSGKYSLQTKIVSRLMAYFSKKVSWQFLEDEEKVIRRIAGFLKENRHIKYYILGHFHACFKAEIKSSSQVILGMGTWTDWLPLFEKIDFKDLRTVDFWIKNLKYNQEDCFSKISQQFPYLKIVGDKVILKFWDKHKLEN